MSHQDGFDTQLAAHFEREHRHVPADVFVAITMRKVRAGRRRREVIRMGWFAAVLVLAVIASSWLIAGVASLNDALESVLTWGQPVLGVLGTMAALAVLVTRVRSR